MKNINPSFLMARRRAQHNERRFGHPFLDYPAIARKGKPLPVDLEAPLLPERSAPEKIPGWNKDTAILVACALAFLTLLFIEV